MSSDPCNIFVSAGEVSGDKILGYILEPLKKTLPRLEVSGIFGANCEKLGYSSLMDLNKISLNGVTDVIKNLSVWIRLHRKVFGILKKQNFSLVILVDFPGFNNLILNYCKQNKIPVYYVAPPQVWPYKNKNISRYKNIHVQPLFDIDRPPYVNAGARVSTGHFFPKPEIEPSPVQNRLGVFPGSRPGVIKRNLPLMIKAVFESTRLQNHFPDKKIYVPPTLVLHTCEALKNLNLEKSEIQVESDFDTARLSLQFAIASPGTITLELALSGVPTLVFSVLDFITYQVGRLILKTRWLALPSGLARREIYPEIVGTHAQLRKMNFDDKITRAINMEKLPDNLYQNLGNPHGADTALNNCLHLLKNPVP